jgi:hypothetical protein
VEELDESDGKLVEILKTQDPEQLLFEARKKRSMQPLPSGCRTKAGEDTMPRNLISF